MTKITSFVISFVISPWDDALGNARYPLKSKKQAIDVVIENLKRVLPEDMAHAVIIACKEEEVKESK